MSNRYEYTADQVAELEHAYHTVKDARQHRRIQVVMLRAQGMPVKAVVAATKVCASTITNLTKAYLRDGLKALTETNYHANHRYLSNEELEEFLAEFDEQAAAGTLVTVDTLYKAYLVRLGHYANRNSFVGLLHRHGWRKVRPRPHHPKQAGVDEKETSKKLKQKSSRQESDYSATWIRVR